MKQQSNQIIYKPIHLIPLLLYAPFNNYNIQGYPIIGKIKFIEMLFLYKMEIEKEFINNKSLKKNFNFDYDSYIPYNNKIEDALYFLKNSNIINIQNTLNDYDLNISLENFLYNDCYEKYCIDIDPEKMIGGTEKYNITSKGIKIMQDKSKFFSWINLSEKQKNLLIKLKTQFIVNSLKTILIYIQYKYPKYVSKILMKKYL